MLHHITSLVQQRIPITKEFKQKNDYDFEYFQKNEDKCLVHVPSKFTFSGKPAVADCKYLFSEGQQAGLNWQTIKQDYVISE